jgi:hypothetical protein
LKPLSFGLGAPGVTPKSPSTVAPQGGGFLNPGFTLGSQQDKQQQAPIEKETFFQKKKREEIERMEAEIRQERAKIAKAEAEH